MVSMDFDADRGNAHGESISQNKWPKTANELGNSFIEDEEQSAIKGIEEEESPANVLNKEGKGNHVHDVPISPIFEFPIFGSLSESIQKAHKLDSLISVTLYPILPYE
jgi:hypothetical protein